MIDLSGKVAIVTGAGCGLGREHAILLARYGAAVLVNDRDLAPAQAVVEEIVSEGGRAKAFAASVTDVEAVRAMVDHAIARWAKVDILVNNAGILRDKTFAKMSLEDFRLIVDVHLMGAVHCTKAVWDHMRARSHGRIVMTTSSSGLYGNFGQANYGAAKMSLVGLMQTLALEGARHDIRVNCIAPTAATQMFEGLLPQAELDLLPPRLVSPGIIALVGDDAPTRTILCAGAGSFSTAHVTLTPGVFLGGDSDVADKIVSRWDEITDRDGELVPEAGEWQSRLELKNAGYARVETVGN